MSLLFALGLLVAAAEPAPAEPVTLLCKGSRIVETQKMKDGPEPGVDVTRTAGDFTWQVTLDLARPSVVLNGKPLYIRKVTEDEVTWSEDKSQNVINKIWPGTLYTIDRRTGAIRFEGGGQTGSGLCEKAALQAKLF